MECRECKYGGNFYYDCNCRTKRKLLGSNCLCSHPKVTIIRSGYDYGYWWYGYCEVCKEKINYYKQEGSSILND